MENKTVTKQKLAHSIIQVRETAGTKWWLISGVGVGLLNVIASIFFDSKLGITTAFSAAYKHILQVTDATRASSNSYLANLPSAGDWELFLLVGLVAGAYIAYRTTSKPKSAQAPQLGMRLSSIGSRRFALVFFGTFLLGYGARLAGGCTTGHILSGWSQLATGSLVFGAVMFPVAMLTAYLLYGRVLGGL